MASKLIVKTIKKETLETINNIVKIEFCYADKLKSLNNNKKELVAKRNELSDSKLPTMTEDEINAINIKIRNINSTIQITDNKLSALKKWYNSELFTTFEGRGKNKKLLGIGKYESILGVGLYDEYCKYLTSESNTYIKMLQELVSDKFGITCTNKQAINSFIKLLTASVGRRYAGNSGILKGTRTKEMAEKTFYKTFFGCLVDTLKSGSCIGLLVPTIENFKSDILFTKLDNDSHNFEVGSYDIEINNN